MEPNRSPMKILILLAGLAACGGGTSKPITPATSPAPAKDEPAAKAPPSEAARSEPAGPDPAKARADLLAAEMAAYEKARPVFEASCARCHSKSGKLTTEKKRGHFDMTTYPFGGHHAMEIGQQIRKSLGLTGDQPTMPFDKKGSVKGDDLALIAAWADAFDAAQAAGAHEGRGDHAHAEHEH